MFFYSVFGKNCVVIPNGTTGYNGVKSFIDGACGGNGACKPSGAVDVGCAVFCCAVSSS